MCTQTQPCTAFHAYVQTCKTLYNSVQPCTAMYNRAQLLKTMYNHIKPCTSMYNHVQLCSTNHNLLLVTSRLYTHPPIHRQVRCIYVGMFQGLHQLLIIPTFGILCSTLNIQIFDIQIFIIRFVL